jgi:dihydrofolate reductase
MKVILYMAITPNGLIAKENDDTSFVSKRDWNRWLKMVKKFRHVVIGRRTYEVTLPAEFEKDSLYVVSTHEKSLKKKVPNVIFTNKSPKNILKMLKSKGFEEILVGGGGGLNSSFMKEHVIDEIILDVQPALFGRGIKVFADSDFEKKLRLIDIKKLSRNEVQLHYKVLN